MSDVLYHQHGVPPKPLRVLKENEDKTLDLGDEAGNLIVGKVKLTETACVGACTLNPEAVAAAKKAAAEKAKAEKSAAEEKAASEKAAAEKAKHAPK